jgi:two-component system OmpR family sensor kinase
MSRLRASLAPGGWPLRRSLTAIVLAVTAASLVVIAVLSVIGLRTYLGRQLDQQLSGVVERANGNRPPGSQSGTPTPPTTSSPLGFIGAGEDTLGAVIQNGVVTRADRIQERTYTTVDAQTQQAILAVRVDGQPHTISVRSADATTNSRTPYRVIAQTRTDGTVVVVGLPRTGVDAAVSQLALIITVVSLAGLLLAGIAGAAIVRRTLRPLTRIAGTATRVSALPLDRGEVALAERLDPADTNPATEVGAVGAALNRLLDHVGEALTARQASETQIRQFVADASHELRTPLAAIRGYAELTRRSREDLPPTVTHAMERVESASVRMSALVDDMLLLARLDAHDSPLDLSDVDVTQVVVEAVSDAHVAGAEHTWKLDVPADPVVVTGDALRLHQVIANLLTNARTHTPPGTSVVVAVRRERTRCVVTVTDDGQGIDPSLQGRLFQRFARGDSSRSREAGSTGLGLAIVDAVVAAHNGAVEVESAPGRTQFRVTLPLRGESAQPPR